MGAFFYRNSVTETKRYVELTGPTAAAVRRGTGKTSARPARSQSSSPLPQHQAPRTEIAQGHCLSCPPQQPGSFEILAGLLPDCRLSGCYLASRLEPVCKWVTSRDNALSRLSAAGGG